MPNHLRKMRGLVKHRLSLMALPQQLARRSRSCKVETTPIQGAGLSIDQSPRATERPPAHEVQDLRLGQGLAMPPSIRHLWNVEHPLESFV